MVGEEMQLSKDTCARYDIVEIVFVLAVFVLKRYDRVIYIGEKEVPHLGLQTSLSLALSAFLSIYLINFVSLVTLSPC